VGQPSIVIVILMGVAGSGKTTVGRKLARALGYRFSDADDFHSRANVEKMARGEQLDDVDREPWLGAMAAAIDVWLHDDANVVLACSALKESYRERLMRDPSRMKIVYLKVSPATAAARVARRVGHFMPGDLVKSQFETLEEPAAAITVDASHPPDFIVRTICDAL
jgi:gluconokinase